MCWLVTGALVLCWDFYTASNLSESVVLALIVLDWHYWHWQVGDSDRWEA